MSENQEIRIVDVKGRELFKALDGGRAIAFRENGDYFICNFKYVDKSHFEVNGNQYLDRDFAEYLSHNRFSIEQEQASEFVGSYRIYKRIPMKDKIYKIGYSPKAVQPYATWQSYEANPMRYDWGHYWNRRDIAETDLVRRVEAEQTGKSYDYTKLMPQNRDNVR